MPDYNRPTIDLYRVYGENDALLYIGISIDVTVRLEHHSRTQSWWHETSRVEIERLGTSDRAVAEEFEADAIRAERPKHNIIHNTRSKRHGTLVDNSWILDDAEALVIYGQIYDNMTQLLLHVARQHRNGTAADETPPVDEVGNLFTEIGTMVMYAQRCPRCRIPLNGYRSLPIKIDSGAPQSTLLSLCTVCMKTHKGITK
jgi:predicted GIY-YIG superfamily endonuclease